MSGLWKIIQQTHLYKQLLGFRAGLDIPDEGMLPNEGSQLDKGCQNMTYSFTDSKQRLSVGYSVQYMTCPVGDHYAHGKVEKKIRDIEKCIKINVENERLSIIQ